jgi:C4-dicarboxylate-specific signal transduction histidine kinase
MATFPGAKSRDSRLPFWLGLLARSGLGIQGRFLLLVAAVITAIVLAFSWFFVHRERAIIETELFKRARSLASNLAFNSTLGVLTRDTSGLSELASGIARSEDDIVYAMIVDKDGTILGHSLSARVDQVIEIPDDVTGFVSDADMQSQKEESQEYLVHFIMPVERVKQDISREELLLPGDETSNLSGPYTQGKEGEIEEIGKAVVGVSLLGIQSMMAQLKLIVAILAAIIGSASIFAVYGMARAVAIPIKRLVAATEKVAAGDLSHMVEAKGRDEVAELAHSFNHMILDLRKYHEEVEDYSRTLEEKVSERTIDLEEANKSLKETQAQLIQASKMAAMGQFGAGVAHELNQPLAGISGYTDLLLLKLQEETPEWRYAKKVEDQCVRMTKIISNLRTFARQSKFEYAETDINQPIDDALMLLGEQLRSHSIKVKRDLASNLPKVLADANQLEQVFLNLFSNAKDAIDPKGSGVITITSRQSPQADFIEVLVSDSGTGMDTATINDIFNPFFTTKDVGKGTGLGLSISLGIIEDHGGQIEVHSVKDKGTLFRVSLPVLNAPRCWELVNCLEVCGVEKEDCSAYKNQKGHTCWQEMAKRHRRKGDPHPPHCKECKVFKRKVLVPLEECWNPDEVAVV